MNKMLSPVVGVALAGVVVSAHADFLDDSHADVTLLNRYLNQQGRGITGSNAQSKSYSDWGQGFEFNFKSGYTDGPVGFGLDTQLFYGVKLDGGGDLNDKDHQSSYPGSMFPLDDGKSADSFAVVSPTFKMRFLQDELKIGTLFDNNPVLANSDGRLYEQTNTGAQLVSKDLKDFTFTAGDILQTKARDESGDSGMIVGGGAKTSDRFMYGGADYTGFNNTKVSLWYANLEDYYEQAFFGVKHHDDLSVGTLDTDFRSFRSLGVGGNASGDPDYATAGYYANGTTKGEINQATISLMESYGIDGHTFGLGVQKNTGNSDFPFLDSGLNSGAERQGPGSGAETPALTAMQLNKFQHAGERTYIAQYKYDLSHIGLTGLSFAATYAHGDQIREPQGSASEWERNLGLTYNVTSGTLKGVNVRWLNARANPSIVGQTRQDENRFYVSYVIPLW